MRAVLVDTDILVNFLRGRQGAREFLVSLLDDTAIFCSVVTVAEIFAGMRPQESQKTRALLDNLEIVEVDRTIAEKAGQYKGSIRSQALELDDCFIAATAFVRQAALATGNGKHYPMADIEKIIVRAE